MRIKTGLALALALAPCWAAPLAAASLRTATTLHGPLVFVRDLFDDAGDNADRVLGPGPAPGDRIVVEAAQLNAIARQFNIAWRSVSAADRAVLEWPGRPLGREEVADAVKAAATAAGAPDDSEVDMPGFAPLTVPVESKVALAVVQMDYDGASGRFTAALSVTAENMNGMAMRVAGKIEPMVEVPVPLARVMAETVLRPEDLRMARIRAALLPGEAATGMDQVVGMEVRRAAPAGQPLRLADLARPALVQRGAVVQVALDAFGLSVSGQATALDSGAAGERIRVQNANSKAFMYADVVGPGQVRIAPGAPPAAASLPARSNGRVRQP